MKPNNKSTDIPQHLRALLAANRLPAEIQVMELERIWKLEAPKEKSEWGI